MGNLHPKPKETVHLQAPLFRGFNQTLATSQDRSCSPGFESRVKAAVKELSEENGWLSRLTNHRLQQPRSPLISPAPSPHPVVHGQPLGDASRNIRGLRLEQPRRHGDGTHQLGDRLTCDLRTPLLGGTQGTDLGCCHAQDPRRVATLSLTEVTGRIFGDVYDCDSSLERAMVSKGLEVTILT